MIDTEIQTIGGFPEEEDKLILNTHVHTRVRRIQEKTSGMSTVEVRTTYLTLYNVCQAFGWLYVLYKSIHGTIDASSLSGAMPAAGSSVGSCF